MDRRTFFGAPAALAVAVVAPATPVMASPVTGSAVKVGERTALADGLAAHMSRVVVEYRTQVAASGGGNERTAFYGVEGFRRTAVLRAGGQECRVVTTALPGMLKLRHAVSGSPGFLEQVSQADGRHESVAYDHRSGVLHLVERVISDPDPIHRLMVRFLYGRRYPVAA